MKTSPERGFWNPPPKRNCNTYFITHNLKSLNRTQTTTRFRAAHMVGKCECNAHGIRTVSAQGVGARSADRTRARTYAKQKKPNHVVVTSHIIQGGTSSYRVRLLCYGLYLYRPRLRRIRIGRSVSQRTLLFSTFGMSIRKNGSKRVRISFFMSI